MSLDRPTDSRTVSSTIEVMSADAMTDDVVFDHPGAADLADRFRMTADELERQTGATRALPAQAARAAWSGPHAAQFDQRLELCRADGLELAPRPAARGRRARGAVGRRARGAAPPGAGPGLGTPTPLARVRRCPRQRPRLRLRRGRHPATAPTRAAAPVPGRRVRAEEPGLLSNGGAATQPISNSAVIPIKACGWPVGPVITQRAMYAPGSRSRSTQLVSPRGMVPTPLV